MPASRLLHELESLHARAYGWALVCCHRDREQASDVLQSSYARIIDGRAAYDGRGELRAFLFGVIRRVASEEQRRVRRDAGRRDLVARGRADELGGLEPTALERMEREEVHLSLRSALAELPERQREVLHLTFYQEMSLAEAAAVLGIRIGSARQHYARGKAALREHCAPLVRELP